MKRTFISLSLQIIFTLLPVFGYAQDDGLVAYYPFTGNADDESVNSNNGTVYGATLTTDRLGNANSAYEFDGVNDYISIPDHSSLDVSSITISAWIYADATPSPYSGIINKKSATQNNTFSTATSTSSLRVSVRFTDNSSNEPHVINTITTGEWQHVVYVIDSGVVRIYRNGVNVLSNSTTSGKLLSNNNVPLEIGRTVWFPGGVANTYYWDGKIDEVKIYNRGLSDCEIASLYNNSPGIRQGAVLLSDPGDQSSSRINIYPNPSSNGLFNLDGDKIKVIKVYNSIGIKVLEQTNVNDMIQLTGNSGDYFLRIEFEDGTSEVKVIQVF